MSISSDDIEIPVDGQFISGTLLTPSAKMPGILFVHGWGGSQQRDLARAKNITGLGCVCLTFDLRGHERTHELRAVTSREDNLEDLLAAYDQLVTHPAVDPAAIAVIGSSYGGYLATILSGMRPVKWLALRVPALYWDADWTMPKQELDRDKLAHYRRSAVTAADNRALAACKEFMGDVLLIESEQDDYVPHATLMSYRAAFYAAHSLTYRIVDGADHALTQDASQHAYSTMLSNWISEMVIGARLEDYPHHSSTYS
ncbi:alpha/beta hydrolase family protein [Pseudomonas sp. NA-150]|uniref:alpha/beta hydrolase family protein n=1 Tax=Pseudomonas sp. NA-150 TaxID=3367525 RepID=UPI0037CA60B2